MLMSNIAMATQLTADAKTKRLPAGTKLRLQLIDTVNTVAGSAGDSFNAMLLDDQTAGTNIILPAGSVIRGCLSKIKPARRLSRGAVVYLDFDHIVTPNGRQLPLTLSLANRTDLTKDGGIYGSKGYGEALKNNWKRAVEITKDSTFYGQDLGDRAFPGGAFITTPICAIGGAFGGGAYLVGGSVVALFKKGNDVILNQGTILDVELTTPIDIQLN